MLRVGDVLEGFCGGTFGETYLDKTVDGVGHDWVVARDGNGQLWFLQDSYIHQTLSPFTKREQATKSEGETDEDEG